MWLAVETQWRIVVNFFGGRYQGIERSAIESTMNLMGVRGAKRRRRIFEQLQDMERAALPILNADDK